MMTNQDKAVQEELKQVWSKPELEIVSIKESTLGGVAFAADGFFGS